MSTRTTMSETMERDIELAQAKLTYFKTQMKGGTAALRAENDERIHLLQQRIEEAKTRLLELNRDHESVGEQLVDGVEDAWRALQDSLRDAVATFEGHH